MNKKTQSENISQTKKDSTKSIEKNKTETTDKTPKVGSAKSLHLNYQLATFQVCQLQNIEKAGNVFGEERSRAIV